MLYVASLRNHPIVASGMYHIGFIKTENTVVDDIGRIIWSHLLEHAYIYFLNNIIMHAWHSNV